MKKIALSMLLFLGANSSLNASLNITKNFYIGSGATLMSTGTRDNVDLFDSEKNQDKAYGATLLVGYSITKFLDLEARFTSSVSNEDDFEQKTWGVFLKPKYEVFENLYLYGLYGVGGVEVTPKESNEDFSVTDVSLGAGVSYKLNSNVSIFADYVDNARHNIEKFDGIDQQVDTKSINAGVIYNF